MQVYTISKIFKATLEADKMKYRKQRLRNQAESIDQKLYILHMLFSFSISFQCGKTLENEKRFKRALCSVPVLFCSVAINSYLFVSYVKLTFLS